MRGMAEQSVDFVGRVAAVVRTYIERKESELLALVAEIDQQYAQKKARSKRFND
jgi:hypothetical protein